MMTIIMLFPYFVARDLANFSQVSKSCNELVNPKSKHCVNFKVLFEAWGINLTPADEKETLISTNRAF
jgi:hypothetical protein